MKKSIKAIRSRLAQEFFKSQIITRLLGGAAWTLAGNLISRLASVGAIVFLARLLGKEQLGELSVVQATLVTLQTIGGLGLGWALTRSVAHYRVTDMQRIGATIYFSQLTVLISSCALALLLSTNARKISDQLLAAPHLIPLLKIAAIQIVFGSVVSLKTGVLMGLGLFKTLAKFNLLSGAYTFALPVIGGWNFGLTGAVCGFVTTQAIDCLLLHLIENKTLKIAGIKVSASSNWWNEKEIFFNFGLPALMGGFLLQGSLWGASIMLVNEPDGYSEMGYYNAANQWFSALMFLPAILGQSSVPLIMESIALGKFSDVNFIFKKSLLINFFFVSAFVIIGSLASPLLMGLYGAEFTKKWPTLVFLLLAAGAAAIQLPAAQIISTSGRMWLAQTIQTAFSITLLIATFYLVHLGSEGVAISRFLAYVAYAAMAFYIAKKQLERLKKR